MPIAKSHSDPDPKKRKPKAGKLDGNFVTNADKYQKMEAIIDEVYANYINGETRTNIIKKLELGLFTSQDEKQYSKRTAEHIFYAALERIKNDMALKREEAQAIILSRLESVYEDGVKMGDRFNAVKALDSMAKLYGLDKQQTSVQVSTKDSNSITISFGFPTEENKDDDKIDEDTV